MTKSSFGLISAVRFEAGIILKGLKTHSKGAVTPFYSGTVGRNNIIYAASGVGVVNAAHATTSLISMFFPDVILLFGIGGAYPSSGLQIGDLAIAEKEIYADTGVLLKDGFHGIEETGFPLLRKGGKKYYNEFPMDKALTAKAVSVSGARSGTFLTVSACTGTRKRALELESRYNALCENMEGAGVAHICACYGVPVIEIRGISNMAGLRDMSKWDKTLSSKKCQQAVMGLLEEIY